MLLIAPMVEDHRGNMRRNIFFLEENSWNILIKEGKVCYNVYRSLYEIRDKKKIDRAYRNF